MPDIAIKSMVTPAPSPSSTAASAQAPSPAGSAGKGAAANVDTPETSTSSTPEPGGFANALQRQLDTVAQASANEDRVISPSDDAAAVLAATPPQGPIDLSALLGTLPITSAQVQPMAQTGEPIDAQVVTVAGATQPASSIGHLPFQHDEVTDTTSKAEVDASPIAAAKRPAIAAAPDAANLQILAASTEESKRKTAPVLFEGMLSATPENLHTTVNPATRPAEHATSEMTSLQIQTPVKAPGWSDELGQKLTLLVGREQHRAEIVLNPPQLGRVEVSLSVNNDQASAQFVAATPAAREALEQAVPRLREVLADAGITLGQTSVNEQSDQGHNQGGESDPRRLHSDPMPAPTESAWLRRSVGLVDTFA